MLAIAWIVVQICMRVGGYRSFEISGPFRWRPFLTGAIRGPVKKGHVKTDLV